MLAGKCFLTITTLAQTRRVHGESASLAARGKLPGRSLGKGVQGTTHWLRPEKLWGWDVTSEKKKWSWVRGYTFSPSSRLENF